MKLSRIVLARLGLAGAVAALLASCVTGCAPASDRCLPAALSTSPGVVSPTETLTLVSGPAGCDLGFDHGHTYSIVLFSSSGENTDAVETPVGHDGSFTSDLVVPESFPIGAATVVVSGSTYDECGDDSGSCAVYSLDVEIVP